MKHLSRVIFANLGVAATATAAWAQSNACAPLTAEAVFGIASIECLQCTIHNTEGSRWVEYGAEPVVRSVWHPGGPILLGDVIVAVDGQLITTPAGGQRLSKPDMNHPAKFTLRRNGHDVSVTVAPSNACTVAENRLTYGFGRGSRADTAGTFRVKFDSLAGRFQVLRDSFKTRTIQSIDTTGHSRIVPRDAVTSKVIVGSDSMTRRLPVDRYQAIMGLQPGAVRTDCDSTGRCKPTFSVRGSRADSVQPKGRDLIVHVDTARVGNYLNGGITYRFGRGDTGVTYLDGVPVARSARDIPSSHGVLGFGLDCRDCLVSPDGGAAKMLLRFASAPAVAGVDKGSAADAAGLQAGDVLRAIDGNSFTSLEGARRFSALKAGERVRFTIERKGKTMELVLVVPGAS